MPWYITDGILQKADSAPTERSILTDITGEGNVVIPPDVIGIDDSAFIRCAKLTSITLPDGMTHIGANAFGWCTNLTRIVIPHSVKHIGAGAFNECSALRSLTLPNGITAIDDNTFSRCSSLPRLIIPQSVTRIGENAFSWCINLQYLSIPSSVTQIGAGAFEECISLRDISLPSSLKRIEPYTFSSCSALIEISLPESITSIGEKSFRRCLSLESITLPKGVASIPNNAFYGCISLMNVSIPQSVTTIEESAFVGCRMLKSITIPNSVNSLGKDAFALCPNLASICIPGNLMSALDKELRNRLSEIRCTANVDKVPPALRPTAFATFAKHEREYSERLRMEHIAAIKRNAARLTEAVCTCPELLHLMCREKLISAKDIDAFTEEAVRQENTEATAVLLDYQANVLTMKAVSKAREKKEQIREKQDDVVMDRMMARMDHVGIDGLNFVVTGKLNKFKKREDIKAYITSLGGRLLSSMSAKADYLITNDTDTGSAKNVKAAELGIVILTEDEFLKMAEGANKK